MKRLLCVLGLLLLAACGAAPQENALREQSEEIDTCELLAFYELAQNRNDIDEASKGNFKVLAAGMNSLFPDCQVDFAGDSSASMPKVVIPVTAVLEDDEWHELDEVGCRAIVTGYGELLFMTMVIGEGLQGLAVDVYFPGKSQPVEMDLTSLWYMPAEGAPKRVSWKRGKVFPLGAYYFDVRTDDRTLRLQWNRLSRAQRLFALECPGRPPRAGDMPMIVEEGALHLFAGDVCTLQLESLGEKFNVQVSGDYNDELSATVILPGETAPAAYDGEVHDVMHNGSPLRRHWLAGEDFPMGTYDIRVNFDGVEYKFAWDRSSAYYDKIHVFCLSELE